MLSLVDSYEAFKEKVFMLAEHDSEYKLVTEQARMLRSDGMYQRHYYRIA